MGQYSIDLLHKVKFEALLMILCFNCIQISCQYRTINGYVEDSGSGERLIGALVYDSVSNNSSLSNSYGYFILKIKPGKIRLYCRYLGYSTKDISFSLRSDTNFNILLNPVSFSIKEVYVDGSKTESIKSGISSISLPIQIIKSIPSLMGETDILKAIQLLPGVQSGTEGTGGLYVRGGGPDQNLVLLDGVPVYNPDHLFGLVSVFNSDAIKNISFIKGGFPAQYGGRLSSVVDITMKEGNNQETQGAGTVGLISSKIMLEGPIMKSKASYLISARRSWIDLVTNSMLKKKQLPDYKFYDLTGKINFIISKRSRVYLSVYSGKDKIRSINTTSKSRTGDFEYKLSENQQYGWGNINASLRWNQVINNKLFNNTSLNYSNYDYFDNKMFNYIETDTKTGLTINDDYKSEFHTGIKDISMKSDFDFQPVNNHNIKFGVSGIYHIFNPEARVSQIKTTTDSIILTNTNYKIKAVEPSFYIKDLIKVNKKFGFDIGLRFSGFIVENKLYNSIEPRISGNLLLTDKLAVKAAYSRMKQYIHLLTSSRVTFSTDLWVPSTKKIKPSMSDQVTLGSVYTFGTDFEISIEGYYKTMHNIIEYSEGSSFLDNRNWESIVSVNGKGRAYGIELLFQKTSGKTTGWIGYTLAKSERKFDNISNGLWYPYKYDRRHVLTILINRQISKNIDAGLTWEFYSGNMFTLISQEYDPYGSINNPYIRIQYFEKRNNYRLPSYHRLDIGINFTKQKKYFYRTWSVNIYNVYNHMNTFFVYYGNSENQSRNDQLVLKKYTLFPILPSLTYNLTF